LEQERRMNQGEIAVYRPEQDGPKAMTCIEANPSLPHGRSARDVRRDLLHEQLKLTIARQQLDSVERVEKVRESKHQNNGRATCNEPWRKSTQRVVSLSLTSASSAAGGCPMQAMVMLLTQDDLPIQGIRERQDGI
jgi:hypothetical protein